MTPNIAFEPSVLPQLRRAAGALGPCALAASQGFVCSEVCLKRAESLDRALDLSSTSLAAQQQLRWFVLPAVLIVIGVLLVWEEPIFGTGGTPVKVLIGILLLISGLAAVIHVLYVKKRIGT